VYVINSIFCSTLSKLDRPLMVLSFNSPKPTKGLDALTEEPTTKVMKEVPVGAATNNQEVKSSKRDSIQPKWCPPGLSKAKRRKLQCARHHKQKKERMDKMREDIFNSTHPLFPPSARETSQIHSGGRRDWANRPGQFYNSVAQSNRPGQFCC
jgi:hypothetical protein